MGSDLAKPRDIVMVDLPREVWAKSGRPPRGTLIRVTGALTFVLLGLAIPGVVATVVLGAIGVAVFAGLPSLVDRKLEALGEQLGKTPRAEATAALSSLEDRKLVKLFAPHAWVQLQKGRLNLILDDGRGAARAFGEAARLIGTPDEPRLMGAQAQGFTLSGDRKDARRLLTELESRDKLDAADRLNLGIVYVEEPGKTERAIELLEQARDELGASPRTDGALALAYARGDRLDEALELVEDAEDEEDALEADPLAAELVKRARKDIRQREGKGDRKAKVRDGKGKRKKKDRRKDRRKKRKGRAGKDEADDAAEAATEDRGTPESHKPTERIPKIEGEDSEEPAESPAKEAGNKLAEAAGAVAGALGAAAADVKARKEAEEAGLEEARREQARAEEAAVSSKEEAKPTSPEPAAVSPLGGTKDKPVFRPPPIPPPPKVGPAPKISAPKIGAPPIKPSSPKPPSSSKDEDKADDGWGGLLGDDDST